MSAGVHGPESRFVGKAAWLFTGAVLLFLGFFAWRFADERLYSDSGYYLARVVNEGSFHIEHGRWVLGLSQALPLIGLKLGLSLKALIVLQSLNNVVWLGACVLFAGRVLQDRSAVTALACVHLIGLTHGLFSPIFELYYGVDLLILFHAVHQSDRLSPLFRWSILCLCFFVAISCHFSGLLLAIGWCLLNGIWRDRRTLVVLSGILVLHLISRSLILSAYEADGLAGILGALNKEHLAYLFSPAHITELAIYVLRHYADVLILACFTALALARSGQRRTALGFTVITILIGALCILYRPGSIHDRYREQVNFALVAWVVMVFCYHVLPLVHWRTVASFLLISAALFRMVRAEWIAPWYAERTALIEAQIELAHRHGVSKGIVSAPVFFGPPHHLIDLSWSTSVESLLLSAKAGPRATVSLITSEDLEAPGVSEHLDGFIFRRWEIVDPTWLDPRYFTPPTGRYVLLPGGRMAN